MPHSRSISRRPPTCWRRVGWWHRVPQECSKKTRRSDAPIWGIERPKMDALLQQIVSGFATGGIYAAVALSLVMTYVATNAVNFAQGEMAMFSTFLAWAFIQSGMSYWAAFFVTLAISFVGGVAIERAVLRPLERAPVLAITIVTISLLAIFHRIARRLLHS